MKERKERESLGTVTHYVLKNNTNTLVESIYLKEKSNLTNKREKGVTLISLIIYVVVMVLVIALIAVITSFFYNNVMNIDREAIELAELNKLNLYMIEETEKEGNSIETISSDGKKIVFKYGNTYTIQDNGIYQNSIRICKNVNTKATEFGKIKEKGKEILKVYYETETGIGRSLEYVVKDNNVYIAWEDELNYTEGNNNISEEQTTIVPIPEGYVISEVEGENKIEDGLVIYEGTEPVTEANHATALTTRNQYVWIPVEDINDMVMCSSNSGNSVCNLEYNEKTGELACTSHPTTATDLVGRLYTSTNVNNGSGIYSYTMDFSKRDQIFKENDGNREPAILTGNGSQYDGNSNYLTILAGMPAGSTTSDFLDQQKSDFTVMATSVAKNGGFYISRYETGKDGESKKGQEVLTAASNSSGGYLAGNTWYGLYYNLRNINANQQMIWGCQYDQMIKFLVEGGEEAYIGHNNRNLAKSPALSGSNNLDKMKNIYDLEGNFSEWTQEANSNNVRVSRGSDLVSTNTNTFNSVSGRSQYGEPSQAGGTYTSRRTLYI